MKNNAGKENFRRPLKFISVSVIMAAQIGIYWFFWIHYYNRIIQYPFWRRGNWLILVIYACQLLFFNQMYGGLRIGFLRRGNLIYSLILSASLTNILAYLQIALIDKRFHEPLLILLIEAADIIAIILWVSIFQYIYAKVFPPRRLLYIYGEKPEFRLMEKINAREDKYILTGAISGGESMDKILREMRRHDAVVIGDISSSMRNQLIKICYAMNMRSYILPKISDVLVRSAIELNIFDTPLFLSRNDGLSIEQEFVKRCMDIVLALLGLILSAPFFMVCAILIKLQDGGPVFYRQTRLTKGGKIFQIYKFRTMIMDAEKHSGPKLASQGDSRITPIGRFLRACRMDELPQLLNILKGEMSIVGPRPERPELASVIEKNIPEFAYRLKVKAGLTGYAQFYGKYNTTAYDKLKLDLTYIRNYSLLLDLKLILLTPKILLLKESTEGVNEEAFVDPALLNPDDQTSDIKAYRDYIYVDKAEEGQRNS